MLTQAQLKEIWEYDIVPDRFTWKIGSKFRKLGSLVSDNDRVYILGYEYRYQRLKELYFTGIYRVFTQVSKNITWEELISVLNYNTESGIFIWKECRGPYKLGDMAGSLENTGYISIRIGLTAYLAHRLAWFYCFKEWPTKFIDHIDRNKANNSLDNLRELDQVWNSRNRGTNKNNTSGFTGVYFSETRNKWVAEIILNKIKNRLGYYDTAVEASIAYKDFEKNNTYENITIG